MTQTRRPNKYAGTCRRCGNSVPAETGWLGPKIDGRWTTEHSGDCPTTNPDSPAQPAAAAVTFTPTAEQAEIVRLFATGANLVVQAGAGTGKTSTLRLLARHAQANGRRGTYAAYNRSLVDDVAGTMPGNVSVNTMHAYARQALALPWIARRLNAHRQYGDEQARILGIDPMSIPARKGGTRTLAAGWLASKVMGATKRYCASQDDTIGRRHFEYINGLDNPDEHGTSSQYANNDAVVDYLLPFATRAWADLTRESGRLRFTHDAYLKMFSLGDPVLPGDFVLFDEAQDADPVQELIVRNQVRHGKQVVVVGDEMQVLYEWRGAINALSNFEAAGANVAFLSQSFRFGDAVAEVANGLLDRLTARLRITGFGPVASMVGPTDEPSAVLCRTNAGAVRTVLAAIQNGRRPHLVGNAAEIINFCKAARRLQLGQHCDHPELGMFDSWAAVQAYVAESDEGADLKLMVKLVDEFGADTIRDALENQPSEADADLVVSTVHKSKGREWNIVQIGGDFVPPTDSDLPASELRLAYVASTRAKLHLDLTAVPHFGIGWQPGPAAPDGQFSVDGRPVPTSSSTNEEKGTN